MELHGAELKAWRRSERQRLLALRIAAPPVERRLRGAEIEAKLREHPALGTGDSVRHQTFGEGVVIGIDANGVVAIRFEDGSERKLMLDYAPLEKL